MTKRSTSMVVSCLSYFINRSICRVLKSLSGIVVMVLNDNDVSFICLINDDSIVIR